MDKYLHKAKSLISADLNDSSADLGFHVATYGIAKMLYSFDKLKLDNQPKFIGTSDMGVTRNEKRFKDGFSYGGMYSWIGSEDVIVLNARPNACGMVVFGLSELPDTEEFAAKCANLQGVISTWDITAGNHFILLGKIEGKNLPPYFAVIHAGGAVKETLYFDKNKHLRKISTRVETPWGNLRLLIGDRAREYYQTYKSGAEYAKQMREGYGMLLFNNPTIIANTIHQGLWSNNEILLGAQRFTNEEDLFPVTLNSRLGGYLVRGKTSKYNLLPHGGGYSFPQYKRCIKVISAGNRRLYVMELEQGNQEIFEYPTSTYSYRGQEVIKHMVDNKLGVLVAKLIPTLSLKI